MFIQEEYLTNISLLKKKWIMWNHLKKEKNYRNFGKTGMNDTFPNIRQRSNLFYSQNTLIFICSYMHNLIKQTAIQIQC